MLPVTLAEAAQCEVRQHRASCAGSDVPPELAVERIPAARRNRRVTIKIVPTVAAAEFERMRPFNLRERIRGLVRNGPGKLRETGPCLQWW
jgi:hypothetical protein